MPHRIFYIEPKIKSKFYLEDIFYSHVVMIRCKTTVKKGKI